MKADLHIHTSFSFDSTASPKEMVDAALKKGIDCLAINDHGEIKGALEAREYAQGKPILIIPGIEVKTKEGDVLGLNIETIIPNKLSAKETIKRIKDAGGMAVLPHPFGWLCSFKEGLENLSFQGNLKELMDDIDAIEVFNASILGLGNKKAWDLVQKYNLPFTAGSDAHSPNFVGKAYLEIPGENLSVEEVLEKIKNRNCKIGGKKVAFLESVIDHTKRNVAKVINYVNREKRKI